MMSATKTAREVPERRKEIWSEGWTKWGKRRAKQGKQEERKRREGQEREGKGGGKGRETPVLNGGLAAALPPLDLDDPNYVTTEHGNCSDCALN